MTVELVLLLLALVGNSFAALEAPAPEESLDMAARIERSKQACLAKATDPSVPPCRRPTYEPPSEDSPYGLGVCVYTLRPDCVEDDETDGTARFSVSAVVLATVALSVLF